jgi:autotransporter translocation and assembly factor TamB
MLILSIPAVQTYLGKKVTTRINEDFGTNISIGKIGLQINGDVELKSIYIEDYKKDTLININELNTSILNFRSIINGKLAFGDIDIEDLTFNIRTYKGEPSSNLDVFIAKFEEDNPSESESEFLLSSSDVSIYNGKFRMINDNLETPKILELSDLNFNGTNFLINGSDVSTRINTFAFKDSRGIEVKNLVSNFEYTLYHMSFEGLSIKTPNSNLQGDLRFDYQPGDFSDFTNKVNIKANFKDSEVLLDELNVFYNEFGVNQKANLSVNLSGTLNDLNANDLLLSANGQTRMEGDINFKNLFNKEENNFIMDGRFDNLSSNYGSLKALLPNVLGESIPSIFAKLGNFYITGTTLLTPSTIDADLVINTGIGKVDSNLSMKSIDDIDNASYVGDVIFENFDIGVLLNDPTIKETSFDVDVNGKGFTLQNLKTNIKGQVFSLNYNDYAYKDIEVSGQLGNNVFNGLLISKDENFKFKFNGLADLSKDVKALDFTADVEYANLKTLNFVKNDSISVFKGIVTMSMKGTGPDDAFGILSFDNTTYINENDEYYFEDFQITSKFEGEERLIEVNSPDIIEGSVRGVFKFKDIGKLIENSIGSIYTNYVANQIDTEQYLDFNFTIYNKIVEVFLPEIEIGANTSVKGRIETDEQGFNLTFKSPKIKLLDYFANDILVDIDNSNPLFNTYVQIDSIGTGFYNISKFDFINVTSRDTLFIKTEFKGGNQAKDDFNLSLFYTIDKNNKSVAGFKRSDVTFKENNWLINRDKDTLNKVTFDRGFKTFDISTLVINHQDEEIELSGIVKDSTYKSFNLNFRDVDLNKITPAMDSVQLEGIVNGELDILQENGVYLPNSNVTIDDIKFNEHYLGNLTADIVGNSSLTNYQVDLLLQNDNLKSLIAKGNIDVSKENSGLNLNVEFDEFLLDPLNIFLEGVLSNIRGYVSGLARVSGTLKNPSIDGNLNLDNAGMTIPYLNVDYVFDFDSEITLENQRFIFNNITLTDSKFFSKANLNGYISHQGFSDWRLGLDIETDRLLVLNTQDSEDALYYGTAFINGSASIYGLTDELVINVTGSTGQGTFFKIPLNDMESFGDNSYINYLSPEEKEARLKGEIVQEIETKGLELNFDLDLNQNADIEIVIDRKSGSTIQGRGDGNLLIAINTNGKFEMYGDFIINSGNYKFAYGGLIEKDLKLVQGGNIRWNGDPLKAQIDLTAIYKTNANPSVLLDNPVNRSIDVEVQVNLTGQLEQPQPDFSFNFPGVDSATKSELEYRLETKERRENQALFLLATNSFASDLSVGQQAYGTISDRVNSLFNNLLSSDDDKVKVGFNYQSGQETPEFQTDDRLGLTLSTKISDRILFNGKVGVPIGGVNETVIAGDVEIQLLLNDDGSLSAKFFNRENSIRNFGEEIGYTQGAGLSYNVEFDTFKELLQIIFSGKKKKEEEEAKRKKEEATKEDDESPLEDYIKINPKKDKNQN